MFVGYPESHAKDTYQMWDPRSQCVHVTRDITWLNRMFFKDVNSVTDVDIQFEQILRICEDPINANNQTSKEDDPNEASSKNIDSEDVDISLEGQNPGDEDGEEGRKTTRSGRISKKPKKFNDYVTAAADLCEEFLGIGAGIGEGIINTMDLQVKTYRQAMKSPDKDKWLAAVEEECQMVTTRYLQFSSGTVKICFQGS
jgi:hypothetical protein